MKFSNNIRLSGFREESPRRSDRAEEYLCIYSELIMSLLDETDVHSDVSKLSHCYWCVNVMKSALKKNEVKEQAAVVNSVIKMYDRLKNLPNVGSGEYSHCMLEMARGRLLLSPIAAKYNSRKHKTRRKARFHKRSKNSLSDKKTYVEFTRRHLDIQYLIDQLYIEMKSIFTDICLDDDGYINNNSNVSSKVNLVRPLSQIYQMKNSHCEYREQLWSGDCKINGDSQDGGEDNFEDLLKSNDIDLIEFNDGLFSDYRRLSNNSHRNVLKSRLKRDSDFDEGFSENESLDDAGSSSLANSKLSELGRRESCRYNGDCDHNSSNSKKMLQTSFDKYMVKICSNDTSADSVNNYEEESDSDGGTELLNSVNATVNKFNAIMEQTVNCGADHKHTTLYSVNSDRTECSLRLSLNTDQQQPLIPATMDTISTANKQPQQLIYIKERVDSPPTNYLSFPHNVPQQLKQNISPSTSSSSSSSSSPGNISNCGQVTVPKMMVPPMNVQNWCSYNCNYIPSQSFNYYPQQSKNYDINNQFIDNYEVQKLPQWTACTNTYNTSTSHHHHQQQQQQQLHRIILSQQLAVPSISLGAIQHSIVHLPPLFQQHQQSPIETDYFGRQYTSINPKLFSGPNNSNCSNDSFVPSSASNCSISHTNSSLINKNNICQSIFKASLDKSQRACCFYMRGGCKKEDCEYAHDLSKVICKFWEKGDCFKADTCPFKHGYQKD